jgi:hypothetical protein
MCFRIAPKERDTDRFKKPQHPAGSTHIFGNQGSVCMRMNRHFKLVCTGSRNGFQFGDIHKRLSACQTYLPQPQFLGVGKNTSYFVNAQLIRRPSFSRTRRTVPTRQIAAMVDFDVYMF